MGPRPTRRPARGPEGDRRGAPRRWPGRAPVALLVLAAVLGPAAHPRADAAAPHPAPPAASRTIPGDAGNGPAAPATAAVVGGPPRVVWTRDEGVRRLDPADGAAAAAADLRALAPLTARLLGTLDAVAPFPWRRAVRSLAIGCRPVGELACPGGVVEEGDRVVISPSASRWSEATLTYVLHHELAHVWQHATGDLAARRRDLDGVDLGPDVAPDLDPLEAAADCLAAAWGSPSRGSGYLACPERGVARMAAVVAATAPVAMASGPEVAPQASPGARAGRGAGATPSSTARTAASVRPSTPSFR